MALPTRVARRLTTLFAWTTVLGSVLLVISPWLTNVTTFGFHDWDVETSHRYLVKLSLLRYGEMPGWNPYACGGFPAWGFMEGATNLVSPWLLPYLVLPMALALRVEVIGMALVGALGAYAVAGQLTRSKSARALIVALWAVDSRWSLQAAAGHTWHLAYGLMPWCFYFFERARREPRRFAPRLGLAVALAMMLYGGGAYPLVHTVLALGLYATLLAVFERSVRPLVTVAGSSALAFGFAAPKLLPMLHVFRRAPRLVDSVEKIDLRVAYELLTSTDQRFKSHHGRLPLGWHEYGMYVSLAGLGVLLLAILLVRGPREKALKVVGAVFVVLGFGAFHPAAPWTLVHAYLPFFSSQHVPSRFLYPGLLLLALVAAAGLGRFTRRRPWREAAVGAAVLALGVHVAWVARQPMTQGMWMVAPSIPDNPEFRSEQEPPFEYVKRDWAGSVYLAMLGNRGVINCYGTPPFDEKGARAATDPRYRGEAFVDGADESASRATARVATWSPNHAVIDLEGAAAGSTLVYNMNYDDGWRSDAGPVIAFDDKVAVRLDGSRSTVTLTYRPPLLAVGLILAALSLAASTLQFWRERCARRMAPSDRAW